MHQVSASDELPALLARNTVSASEIAALGELVARFHLQAAVSRWTGVPERTQAMYASVLGNLDQLLAHSAGAESRARIDRLIEWTHENARALEQTLPAREQEGLVRECHGDLHSANIVRWRDRLLPFDCIEFDPQLRWIDVINDLAFIVMDLAYHERSDLSYALLSRYLEVTGDYKGVRVLSFVPRVADT
jgi:aminoglycoside phosphotransferase family enzyme